MEIGEEGVVLGAPDAGLGDGVGLARPSMDQGSQRRLIRSGERAPDDDTAVLGAGERDVQQTNVLREALGLGDAAVALDLSAT